MNSDCFSKLNTGMLQHTGLTIEGSAEISENTIHSFKTPHITYSYSYNDSQTSLSAVCRELLSTLMCIKLLNLLKNPKVGIFINPLTEKEIEFPKG